VITPEHFDATLERGVCTITLNRPDKLNALTFEVYHELRDAFYALAKDPEVRTIVVTGKGRAFCSGGDVNSIIGALFGRDAVGLLEFTSMTCDLIRAMRQCPKPVIAAVNGIAAGAGAMIALASDIRIGDPKSRFAFLFVKVGLSGADMGATFLLPRVVGLGRATKWLMTGEKIDAATAHTAGLLNEVVAEGTVLEEATALARELANGPASGLAVTKRLLNTSMGGDLESALEQEAIAQALCMEDPDYREAYEAFTEKRAPKFRGAPDA
jgi:enoyl-CoA hydratase/carnithine racemase